MARMPIRSHTDAYDTDRTSVLDPGEESPLNVWRSGEPLISDAAALIASNRHVDPYLLRINLSSHFCIDLGLIFKHGTRIAPKSDPLAYCPPEQAKLNSVLICSEKNCRSHPDLKVTDTYSYSCPGIPISAQGIPSLQVTRYYYSCIPIAAQGIPSLQAPSHQIFLCFGSTPG